MRLHIVFACLAPTVAGGCATPHQYVYNCTPFVITFGGQSIAPKTFEASFDTPANAAKAVYPDGSVHEASRVRGNQVDSFAYSNTWISPANVCRQFASQVVIVDLR